MLIYSNWTGYLLIISLTFRNSFLIAKMPRSRHSYGTAISAELRIRIFNTVAKEAEAIPNDLIPTLYCTTSKGRDGRRAWKQRHATSAFLGITR